MSGYTLSLANDYTYTANRETVDLLDRNGTAVVAGLQDAKRLMQDLMEKEASLGHYLGTLVDFRLPAANVGTVSIVPGMHIRDSESIVYVILDVDPPSTYTTVWKVYTIALNVMGDEVDWRQVNQTTNDYGDRITDPTTFPLKGHYNCWIQPLTANEVDILGKRGFLNRYYVYMLDEPELSYGDLFVDQNNDTYKIVTWESRKTLDQAFRVLVEIQP